MAFHQLEKVLARAATNRSFRDELAAGDADLDELGLSDDEQSVLSELVASSGAGLDAVLNVVAALPTNAGTGPGTAAVPSIPSMPAMQAMGMAAMTSRFQLHESGSGAYEGSGALQSGGSWQVTISAQKNGQRLAVKQLRVNATGGM